MPREKLTLDVETQFDDDDLDRLESSLDSIDRSIADTGDGRDEVGIDFRADIGEAMGEIASLQSQIEAINDDITIDVDVNRDTIGAVGAGGGNTELATSGGRQSLSHLIPEDIARDEGIANRMSESVAVPVRGRNSFQEQLIASAFEDADVDLSDDVLEELTTATTANPPTHFDGPFGQGTGSIDNDQRVKNLMQVLDGENALPEQIGEVDIEDILTPNRDSNAGLAAEGLPSGAAVSLRQAQMDMPEFDDSIRDRSAFRRFLDASDDFVEEFINFEFTIESFHKIFASLVPLAVAFVGAMPAAISALIGLAGAALAAAGAIGAVGLLGLGGMALQGDGTFDVSRVTDRLRGIADAFITAFTPLMESLAPVVQSAFTQIELMSGPLATASEGLMEFRGVFDKLIGGVTQYIPNLVASVVQFADVFMPMVEGFGAFLANANFLQFFANQLNRLQGPIRAFIIGIKQVIPLIVTLSEGIFTVISVLALMAGGIALLINKVPFLAQVIGAFVGAALIAATITTLWTLASVALTGSLGASAGAMLTAAKSSLVAAASFQAGAASAFLFWSTLLIGIAAAGYFVSRMKDVENQIANANSELQKFNELANADTPDSIGVGTTTGSSTGQRSGGNVYKTIIDANGQDEAARQQYSNSYERQQHTDAVFGG